MRTHKYLDAFLRCSDCFRNSRGAGLPPVSPWLTCKWVRVGSMCRHRREVRGDPSVFLSNINVFRQL